MFALNLLKTEDYPSGQAIVSKEDKGPQVLLA